MFKVSKTSTVKDIMPALQRVEGDTLKDRVVHFIKTAYFPRSDDYSYSQNMLTSTMINQMLSQQPAGTIAGRLFG